MKLNKNGFTLMELIASIIIVAFIMMIIYPSIQSLIDNNNDDIYSNYEKVIVEYIKVSSERKIESGNEKIVPLCALDELKQVKEECVGYVKVETIEGKYTYKPYILCGERYQTCYSDSDCFSASIYETVSSCDGSTTSLEQKIAALPLNLVYCKQNLIYSGSNQTLTNTPGDGYTFSGNTGNNAGEYTVTATLKSGYIWSDNTTENKTFTCSIGKATPTLTLSNSSLDVSENGSVQFTEKANVTGSFTNTVNKNNISVSPSNHNNVTGNTNKTVTVNGISTGSGIVTVAFTPSDTNNYNIKSATISVNVAAASINNMTATIPTNAYCKQSLTYNGSNQTLTNTPGDGYTFSGNTGNNAGEYTVTATLKSGYIWSDNTTGNKTFKCSIRKATPTLTLSNSSLDVSENGSVQFTEKANVTGSFTNTVNKNNISVSPSNHNNVTGNTNKTVTVNGISTGSGIVTVAFTPSDTNNYYGKSATIRVNVAAASINYISATIPTNTYCKQSLTYNGSNQTLTNTPGDGYTFSGNTGNNAGEYTVTATLKSGYIWSDNTTGNKTFTCSIGKATPTLMLSSYSADLTVNHYETINVTEYTGDGKLRGTLSGYITTNTNYNNEGWYAYYNNSPVYGVSITNGGEIVLLGGEGNAGNYTVSIISDATTNYKAVSKDITVHYYVTAQIPTNTYCKQSLTYNGSNQTLTNTPGDGYTFSGNTGNNAGEYTVTATLKSGYIWSDNTTGNKTFTCSIGKATPILTLSNSSLDVSENGSVQFTEKANVKGTFSNSVNNNKISVSPSNHNNVTSNTEKTVTVSGISTGSGVVTIVFVPSDSNYYGKSATIRVNVAAASINYISATIPTNTYCRQSLTYNGSNQTLTNSPGEGYTFSGNTGKNAGEYTVTATLKSGYIWSDNTTGNKTFTCSIGKATPTLTLSKYNISVSSGTFSDSILITSYTGDGQLQASVEGYSISSSGNGSGGWYAFYNNSPIFGVSITYSGGSITNAGEIELIGGEGKAGNYTVSIFSNATTNYKAVSKDITVYFSP